MRSRKIAVLMANLRHGYPQSYRVSTRQIPSSIPNGTYEFSAWVCCSNRPDDTWRKVSIGGIAVTGREAAIQFFSRGAGGSKMNIDNVSFIRVR